MAEREAARRASLPPIDRAAEAFIVHGERADTIIAGYPWFTDWGRDTFIAMRGLVLARGRHDIAAAILLAWAETVSEGMLPNRFPEHGGDAGIQFRRRVACGSLSSCTNSSPRPSPTQAVRARLLDAAIGDSRRLRAGTRFGIRMDNDGLLACGVPGVQLTWMDARVDGRVITPRIGKPVEVAGAVDQRIALRRGTPCGALPTVRRRRSLRDSRILHGGLYRRRRRRSRRRDG